MEHEGRPIQSVLTDYLLEDSRDEASAFLDALNTRIWKDPRILPCYIALASLVVLVIYQAFPSNSVEPSAQTDSISHREQVLLAHPVSWFSKRGSFSIFTFKLIRFLALVALSALTITAASHTGWTWCNIALVMTSGYTTILGIFNVFATVRPAATFSLHLTVVSLSTLAVYIYRDVWPLMTFDTRPDDEAEGRILWWKVTLALLAGIVLPILEPYPHIPVNPSEPLHKVNPEQTASLLSLVLYIFLDPVVLQASRVEHLGHDRLPPLADYDHADNLAKRSYRHLDPFSGAPKRRKLFFGLVRVFWRSLVCQTICLLFLTIFHIAGPIGTNRLLAYLENGGEGAIVKPWVWISFIGLAPIGYSILDELYLYFSTGALVRAEAILTSLVFDHALRIRLKAETDSDRKDDRLERVNPDGFGNNTQEIEESAADIDDAAGPSRIPASAFITPTPTTVDQTGPDTGAGRIASHAKAADSDTQKKRDNLLGKINNLITSDLDNIANGRVFLFLLISTPLDILVGMWFLYVILGWSSFAGLLVLVILAPGPALLATLTNTAQKQKMKATDARVQNVTEMMSVLRMIKLFGWETRIKKLVAETRQEELKWVWKRKLLVMLSRIVNQTIPLIHMVVTYGVYTIVQKKPLTASIVFSSWYAFNTIRMSLFRVFRILPILISAHVSLGRVAEFLNDTELLDLFSGEANDQVATTEGSAEHQNEIGFRNASFSWSNNISDASSTPSQRNFILRIDNEIVFQNKRFNLIIGPTGSGKTSILMALLGEMHYIPSGPEAWVNLPREGGVAYVAQESWVLNETIRENIIFGSQFDKARYNKVIYQCGLTRDLNQFAAGDATEVGEKGITLSGGQKARITLARAIYSQHNILLIDDVLAALDVHTSRWIADKCLKGDLVRGRTVILATHNIAMTSHLADFVVSLGSDGRIIGQGPVADTIIQAPESLGEVEHKEREIEPEDEESTIDGESVEGEGKLVAAEEAARGHISWEAIKLFLSGLGGKWPSGFWIAWITGTTLSELFDVFEMWWLGFWARQYSDTEPSRVPISYYLSMYCLIVLLMMLTAAYAELIYTFATLRASRIIHSKLMTRLIGSTFRWLDITPTSRVIARCTQDIQAIDGPVADTLNTLAFLTIKMFMKLGPVIIYTPVFIIPSIFFFIAGSSLGNIYLKAQLPVKREMSNAKAPILAILGSTLSGLASIRAYAAQDAFRKEMYRRINSYVRTARVFNNLNRWVSVRIDTLSGIFTASLAGYLVYGGLGYNPSSVGFVLNMATLFSELILWLVRIYNEFEVTGNSLERVQQYMEIEQEQEPKDGGLPPAYWPSSGRLEVEKLSASYSPDGPKVLENVSFRIEAGERIGIVGRTGSGKSTLTLALLRCIFTKGTVMYDGIPVDTLNLDTLRSNITIIPQIPELLSGTLRHNLDIFGQYDDSILNDALRAAGLTSLQRSADDTRITLDSEIASGGGNLSVGQRQMIALARAIVRQSKLLIIDEATSAIDHETDALIQASLRKEFRSDVTVITIAHRLQTIMDSDKVMVLDAGHLVEFDTPEKLLKQESLLRALVDESVDKEALYAVVKSRTT